jgi:hypothetical protein
MIANRRTVEALKEEAERLGYRVHEYEPNDFSPDELMLDLDGHGELFEAYFRRHDRTGYWRFDRGFRHVGVTGDTYRTLKGFREIIKPVGDVTERAAAPEEPVIDRRTPQERLSDAAAIRRYRERG